MVVTFNVWAADIGGNDEVNDPAETRSYSCEGEETILEQFITGLQPLAGAFLLRKLWQTHPSGPAKRLREKKSTGSKRPRDDDEKVVTVLLKISWAMRAAWHEIIPQPGTSLTFRGCCTGKKSVRLRKFNIDESSQERRKQVG